MTSILRKVKLNKEIKNYYKKEEKSPKKHDFYF